uniref:Uncharacterized protein n=1 Tax=candidate division WOR-3 bacterium TaxID=2052148 RepID=A0A7C6EBJ2_UNCW3
MLLEYISSDGKQHRVKASLSYDHPDSNYGIPVILLEDGSPLDLTSWVLLGYRVVRAGKKEIEGLRKIYAQIGFGFM